MQGKICILYCLEVVFNVSLGSKMRGRGPSGPEMLHALLLCFIELLIQ